MTLEEKKQKDENWENREEYKKKLNRNTEHKNRNRNSVATKILWVPLYILEGTQKQKKLTTKTTIILTLT